MDKTEIHKLQHIARKLVAGKWKRVHYFLDDAKQLTRRGRRVSEVHEEIG